ncbi:hypothetical protein EBX93_16820 [bacterium]|nr:hypothetical protein [bacterium]
MAVYKKSRYADCDVYNERSTGVNYLGFKETNIQSSTSDVIYQFKGGDRLDNLANQFYGSPKYKWIILYANPQYFTELDISEGDTLIIPQKERILG